ncbi:MAG TPA: hypothetical protein PK981_04120 [Accumulibacter sp.]|nr:hypothetical protein [Accumulibacter sp.]HMW17724.1 hypothetical protein [Accumulibacter sp.]HMX21644.1 hypothetical protein [Accumulibacter sp.]HMY06218.1 hypothetical protein [Accumulibacter sp.]HNC18931.1 hypothetical protein [Accumulibacter sp.]
MTAWGCQHEVNGHCAKVNQLPCDPGMKGCVLAGRFFFLNSDEKNVRRREKLARPTTTPEEATPPAEDD